MSSTDAESGLYSGPTLHIAIGPNKASFHVHAAPLRFTDFFKVHGLPPRPEEKAARAEQSKSPSPTKVKLEEDTERSRSETLPPETGPGLDDIFGPSIPDYHLTGPVFDKKAFELIVNWLYNKYPSAPINRNQYRTLMKSYVLALKYNIVPLQDCLINCFRVFHQEYNLAFEDWVWIINRLGDTHETHTIPLVIYLADQIAWEIVSQGYNEFINTNAAFDSYLKNGDHPARVVIVKALANIARTRNPIDPASGADRWRTTDRPPVQKDSSPFVTIDIDDD